MYTQDMTWDNWKSSTSLLSGQTIDTLNAISIIAFKWNQMVGSLTDEEILALPVFAGRTTTDVSNLKYAINTLKDMYDMIHGLGAFGQFDRFGYLVPFAKGQDQ
jgi:hypothetical protein